jgi:hypothetical protein
MGHLEKAILELGIQRQAKSFSQSLCIAWGLMQKSHASKGYNELSPEDQGIIRNLFEAKDRDTRARDRKEKLLAIASGSPAFDELSKEELLERVELLKDRDSKAENARPNLYILVAERRIEELEKEPVRQPVSFHQNLLVEYPENKASEEGRGKTKPVKVCCAVM